MNGAEVRKNLRRGVFIVPTSLTVLNIFFGFMAIMFSIRGTQEFTLGNVPEAARLFRLACICLFVAAVFDTFDGLVARAMKATSEFGKEYDSLADVVTFGAAPAVLVYSWGLHVWGRLGGGIAFLFLVCGSLRLARFNIMSAKTDHRWFIGLPIPGAALTLAAIINYAPAPVTDPRFAAIMLIVTAALAFAMVSTIRYRSQKYASLQKEKSFAYLLVLAVLLVIFARWPAEFVFIWFTGYFVSGPIMRFWSIAFPSKKPPEQPPLAAAEDDEALEADAGRS